MMNFKLIILFTRYPVVGEVKTRLIPELGKEQAFDLHVKMTEFLLEQALKTNIPVQIHYQGGTKEQMQSWLGQAHDYVEQVGDDLGEKMEKAFCQAFSDGKKQVVLMGSDCPNNRTSNILTAFNLLEYHDCVFGPANDGGYYLIGLTNHKPELFQNINWGTEKVLAQTINKIDKCAKGKYALIEKLTDVDYAIDIPPKISVIIINLNEEKRIKNTILQAKAGFNVEIIVSDGASIDQSPEIARTFGDKFILSKSGRAVQMNTGASIAEGEILLFLHADSILPSKWDISIREIMENPEVKLGYFRFAADGDFKAKKILEWGTNFRANFFKIPYGDQGFFIRKKDFDLLGKFDDVPILEDVFMVKKAKKNGLIACTKQALITSGRRWLKYGFWKTLLVNQAILIAAKRGADLELLCQAYREGKGPLHILKIKRNK